jgi:single-strand DNA-binding protein
MYKQGQALVIVRGNVTKDPEMKYTPNGVANTRFSVGVNKSWKTKDGKMEERVSFIPVTTWAILAERVAEYIRKGQEVSVVGELRQERYEQDGKNVSYLHVVAQTVDFGDKAKDKDGNAPEATEPTEDSSELAPF